MIRVKSMAGVEGIEPSSKVLETSILAVGRHPYIRLNYNTIKNIKVQVILKKI